MKTRLLLPNRFKLPGWLLLAAGMALGVAYLAAEYTFPFLDLPDWVPSSFIKGTDNMTDELAALLVIAGGLLVAFSREKEEDEYVARLRLESFMWSVLITYIAIGLGFIFTYGSSFLYAMFVMPFLLLFIFIIRFHVILWRSKRQKGHEE